MTRVFLYEPDLMISSQLESILRDSSDIRLVGTSRDARHAYQEIAGFRSARGVVLVLSCEMPGCQETDLIRAAQPVATLVLSRSPAEKPVISAIRAGARGYIIDLADPNDLTLAIKLVDCGYAAFCRDVARRLSWYFTSLHEFSFDLAFPDLTDREREVLTLIATGLSNAQIARKLVVADKTVRNHITHIFSKLDVSTRAAAIIKARTAGAGQ